MATLAFRTTALAARVRNKLNELAPRLIPAGGTAGQVLKKVDATDYNATWQADNSGAGGSGLTHGQVRAIQRRRL